MIVEIVVLVSCENRQSRLEMWACQDDDKNPARFYGQFSSIGENKFSVNGTLVVDRDLGFNSTLEVRGEKMFCSQLGIEIDHSFFSSFHIYQYGIEVSKCKNDMSYCEEESVFPGSDLCAVFSHAFPVYNTLITKSVPPFLCPIKAVWSLRRLTSYRFN